MTRLRVAISRRTGKKWPNAANARDNVKGAGREASDLLNRANPHVSPSGASTHLRDNTPLYPANPDRTRAPTRAQSDANVPNAKAGLRTTQLWHQRTRTSTWRTRASVGTEQCNDNGARSVSQPEHKYSKPFASMYHHPAHPLTCRTPAAHTPRSAPAIHTPNSTAADTPPQPRPDPTAEHPGDST